MKRKSLAMLSLLLALSICASAEGGGTNVIRGVNRAMQTRVFAGGTFPFELGCYTLELGADAEAQQIALTGRGERARLSWSAYTGGGQLVIKIQADAAVAPGEENYTLSATINGEEFSEAFTITVAEAGPAMPERLDYDIPALLNVGDAFLLPKPDAALAAMPDASLAFACDELCLSADGGGVYTAVQAGVEPWSLVLTSANFTGAVLTGVIEVLPEPVRKVSAVHSIDISGLDAVLTLGTEIDGYQFMGNAVVRAELADGDALSAELTGDGALVQLLLTEPSVVSGEYHYAVLVSGIQGAGRERYTLTVRAGESVRSEAFEVVVEGE